MKHNVTGNRTNQSGSNPSEIRVLLPFSHAYRSHHRLTAITTMANRERHSSLTRLRVQGDKMLSTEEIIYKAQALRSDISLYVHKKQNKEVKLKSALTPS